MAEIENNFNTTRVGLPQTEAVSGKTKSIGIQDSFQSLITDLFEWIGKSFSGKPASQEPAKSDEKKWTGVTSSMISHFCLPSERCIEVDPCKHSGCKIILTDGREKTVTLDACEINALVQSISADKICSQFKAKHFKECGEGSFKTYQAEQVDSLLSKIFAQP